jgi:hypothetical protein
MTRTVWVSHSSALGVGGPGGAGVALAEQERGAEGCAAGCGT